MAEADDLWTSVKARASTVVAKALSNPQNGAATSNDDTRGTLACTDVISDFTARGITYDNDDARHLGVAVGGVIAKLQMTALGYEWAWKRHQEYEERLERLRMVTANDRMTPVHNSPLAQEDEEDDALPDFDASRFDDYAPGAP